MVAVIKTGHSISRTLNYNENKVKEGLAEIISAVNYPIDTDKILFNHKLMFNKRHLFISSFIYIYIYIFLFLF